MKYLRIILASVVLSTSLRPAWAEGYDIEYRFPTPQTEIDRLVPGQWYERILPDGTVGFGYIRAPNSQVHEKWFEIIGQRDYVPGLDGNPNPDASFNAPSTPAQTGQSPSGPPGSGSGINLGGALERGAIAGAGQIAIQGIYNALIMTPSKQAEIEFAQREFDRSSSERAAAAAHLDQQFRLAFTESAKALSFANWSLKNSVSLPVPKILFIPTITTKKLVESAPADFQKEALPVFEQLNGVKPNSQMQSDVQSIGNAAVGTAAQAAIEGDQELSSTALGVAKQMANLLVGLDPITGTARFGYELFSGKNMITGEVLGPWERAFSGVAFGASLVTLGASATMINAIKGSLAVFQTMKGAGMMAGLAALRESKKIADTLRVMGWTEKEIASFAKFNRSVLKGSIKDFDYSIYAYKNWTPAAKSSFPKIMDEMKSTAGEVAKASEKFGVDSATFLERRSKAIGFYNNTPGFERNLKRIGQHIEGIDFSKSVDVVKVDAGTEVHAWHVRGDPLGNYATREIVPPNKSGLGDLGRAGPRSGLPEGVITPKETRSLEVTEDTFALESTSREAYDTWSLEPKPGLDGKPRIPIDEPPDLKNKLGFDVDGVNRDWLQYGSGGEKQLFFDKKVLRLKE